MDRTDGQSSGAAEGKVGRTGSQFSCGVVSCRPRAVQHDHATRQVERIIEEDKLMVSYFRCIVKNTYWKIG